MSKRWTRRPEGSNWGDFGEDDQLGSLNYISSERILEATQSVTEGRSFCLSLPLDYPGGQVLAPHRTPPKLEPTIRKGRPFFNYRFGDETPGCCDGGCDDRVTLSTQYSTQWDSLAHIGYEFDLNGTGEAQLCFYNGYVAERDIIPPAERGDAYVMPLGIEKFAEAAIQTRGVLLDVEHHFGRGLLDLRLEHIKQVLEADQIEVKPGDILCLHTGFADEILKMNKEPDAERVRGMCAAVDGRDQKLLEWLSDMKIAGLASDNYAVERVGLPRTTTQPAFVPLHHHCLFKRGIPLGELWYLTELASWLRARKRRYFLLTAPPLRLPGAVGSPVTPVATV
ncbi:MAG: cyclase family protein [Phycisphaerales bacterium]|nr:cyclase family protein [Phycisphaerales bacterium]